MKSLLERVRARPFHLAALVIAAITGAVVLWWLLCPQASKITKIKTITNTPIVQPTAQLLDPTSTTMTLSEVIPTDTITATLPTDPALAAEELDRLNDEHTQLKDRKDQLAQQLEVSNKLLVMKEQQLKTLEIFSP